MLRRLLFAPVGQQIQQVSGGACIADIKHTLAILETEMCRLAALNHRSLLNCRCRVPYWRAYLLWKFLCGLSPLVGCKSMHSTVYPMHSLAGFHSLHVCCAAGVCSLQEWCQNLLQSRHSTSSVGLKVYKPTTPGKEGSLGNACPCMPAWCVHDLQSKLCICSSECSPGYALPPLLHPS